MKMASCLGRCQTSRNVFGDSFNRSKALFGIVVTVLVVVITGCVSPAPAGEVIAVSVLDIQSGKAEPGIPVRWGGTITGVQNKNDVTVLEIVSRPLQRSGRPRHNDQTDGRFLAEVKGFLDPQIVTVGRDISLVGTINKVESGQIGEADYQFPVMSVFDYQFWKKLSEIEENNVYPYYYREDFRRDRYWFDWPHRRQSQVYGEFRF